MKQCYIDCQQVELRQVSPEENHLNNLSDIEASENLAPQPLVYKDCLSGEMVGHMLTVVQNMKTEQTSVKYLLASSTLCMVHIDTTYGF